MRPIGLVSSQIIDVKNDFTFFIIFIKNALFKFFLFLERFLFSSGEFFILLNPLKSY